MHQSRLESALTAAVKPGPILFLAPHPSLQAHALLLLLVLQDSSHCTVARCL